MADKPQTKKGFLQVNIAALIFHPGTDEDKARPDHMGDFVEVQPIMYDLFVDADGTMTEAELMVVPEGMEREILAALGELAKLVRLHQPKPNPLHMVGANKPTGLIQQEAPKILDAQGVAIPTKH